MTTFFASRRMAAITLMTTLALTGVARQTFAANGHAADPVPGEPRVVRTLPRGVTPGPAGSILDSARRKLSRQTAWRAEQDRGVTGRKDTLSNAIRNGALIGAIAGGSVSGVYGAMRSDSPKGREKSIAILAGIGAAIGTGVGVLVDMAR